MSVRERPRLNDAGLDPVAIAKPIEPIEPIVSEAPEPEPSPAPASPTKTAPKKRAPRRRIAADDPRGITVWVEPEVFKAIKNICIDERQSMREVMTDAINLLFRRHGKPTIAKAPPPKS